MLKPIIPGPELTQRPLKATTNIASGVVSLPTEHSAQAQHVTNSQGSAGSFQTSKGSAGAGYAGANGNSGFVAKDANNNNVYAGADGNVYKKDSNGNWSKYDNGNWTPVDPSTGAAQVKQEKQNSANSNNLTQSK